MIILVHASVRHKFIIRKTPLTLFPRNSTQNRAAATTAAYAQMAPLTCRRWRRCFSSAPDRSSASRSRRTRPACARRDAAQTSSARTNDSSSAASTRTHKRETVQVFANNNNSHKGKQTLEVRGEQETNI